MRSRLLACLLILIPLALAAQTQPATPSGRLHDLFRREWQFRLREDPLFATSVGVHDADDKLPSQTPADQARRAEATRAFLAELKGIDLAGLSEADRIDAQMFAGQLEDRIGSFEFGEVLIPLNADSGFHTDLARLPDQMPMATVADHERYLSRLRAIPRYFDDNIALLREGIARGMTVPRVTLAGSEVSMQTHIVDDPAKSVFYAPFASFPSTVPETQRERLRAAGRQAVLESVVPAYRKLLDFMTREYIPHARTTLGASELPRGREYYAFLVRRFTTLDLTPEEIHRTGLREVERIRKEMDEVIRQVGFQGDFAAFLKFLRTDPRFYAKTPEELLQRAAWIAKRMDGKLPSLFKTLPRLPYGVAPVPADLAPKYTGGRYVEAPWGSTEPGWYWVNTYALESRPLYNLEALTLHEAVPGHHLQISLSRERESLPEFRRFTYISAFGEGWGLYSEHLGLEAGFYTDPYSNFGRLSYEMWRACRLVVDTGLHSMGWTREQALEYLAANTALPLHEVETETDRYISWPGQALSYKTGELKIRELRARAEKELGDRFDLREFHDAVLANGSIPLPVLEQEIDRYIAAAKAR